MSKYTFPQFCNRPHLKYLILFLKHLLMTFFANFRLTNEDKQESFVTLYKRLNFSLKFSSVNVNQSAGSCGIVHII